MRVMSVLCRDIQREWKGNQQLSCDLGLRGLNYNSQQWRR